MLIELSDEQLGLLSEVLEGERETVGNFIADGHHDEGLKNHYNQLNEMEDYINNFIKD